MLIWIYDFESDKLPKLWSNSDRQSLSEEEAKYIDPCCSSRSDCGDWSEMESWRGREESSFKVSLPTYTPSPSMCFRAHFSLYSPHYLNIRNWLKPVSRCQGLWLARSASVCNSDNLACVQTLRFPFPLEGRGTPVRRLRQSSLSCKWSSDANIFRTITLWC